MSEAMPPGHQPPEPWEDEFKKTVDPGFRYAKTIIEQARKDLITRLLVKHFLLVNSVEDRAAALIAIGFRTGELMLGSRP